MKYAIAVLSMLLLQLLIWIGTDALIADDSPHAFRGAPSPRAPISAPTNVVEAAYNLGYEKADLDMRQAQLRRELDEETKELRKLEGVVVFVDCVERLSKGEFKSAFERGKHNEHCAEYVHNMDKSEVTREAERIMREEETTVKQVPFEPSLFSRFVARTLRRGTMSADSNVWSFVLPVDLERKLVTDDAVKLRKAALACARHSVATPVRDFVRAAFTYAAQAAELRAKGEHGAATTLELAMQREVELAIPTWIPFVLTLT